MAVLVVLGVLVLILVVLVGMYNGLVRLKVQSITPGPTSTSSSSAATT